MQHCQANAATTIQAVGNSGTTGNIFQASMIDKQVLKNVQPATPGMPVAMANDHQTRSSHKGKLCIPSSEAEAQPAHLFPNLHTHALMSIDMLCDAGCIAILDATTITMHNSTTNETVLTGTRSQETKL